MQSEQDVVRYVNESSDRSTSTRFKADVKRVREWKKQIEKITVTDPKKQKLAGGGRKLTNVDLEESLLAGIYDRHSNTFRVSRKMFMFKVKSMHDEMNLDPAKEAAFVGSRQYLEKFMKRNGPSCR